MKVVAVPAWLAETNAYLAFKEGDGRAVLVDVPPEPERIGSAVSELGLTVAAVLLTHGHVDHMGGAGTLAAEQGSSVYVHPDDDFLTLHPGEQLRRMFGMVPPGTYEVPEKMTALEDGLTLDVAGITIETRHTPGHTPGHCCFLATDDGVLFSGDQLFAGSVGRTDLPGGSWEQLVVSMREKVLTLDDDVMVLPGHGPSTTVGAERRSNPFLRSM